MLARRSLLGAVSAVGALRRTTGAVARGLSVDAGDAALPVVVNGATASGCVVAIELLRRNVPCVVVDPLSEDARAEASSSGVPDVLVRPAVDVLARLDTRRRAARQKHRMPPLLQKHSSLLSSLEVSVGEGSPAVATLAEGQAAAVAPTDALAHRLRGRVAQWAPIQWESDVAAVADAHGCDPAQLQVVDAAGAMPGAAVSHAPPSSAQAPEVGTAAVAVNGTHVSRAVSVSRPYVDPTTGYASTEAPTGVWTQPALQGPLAVPGVATPVAHPELLPFAANLSLLDASSLGWRLAMIQRGLGQPALLDAHASERSARAAWQAQTTDAVWQAAAAGDASAAANALATAVAAAQQTAPDSGLPWLAEDGIVASGARLSDVVLNRRHAYTLLCVISHADQSAEQIDAIRALANAKVNTHPAVDVLVLADAPIELLDSHVTQLLDVDTDLVSRYATRGAVMLVNPDRTVDATAPDAASFDDTIAPVIADILAVPTPDAHTNPVPAMHAALLNHVAL